MVTESLIEAEYGQSSGSQELIVERVAPQPSDAHLLEDLANVVFKLRAFMESSEGDVGLGIEMGMQRAADMIENIINRYGQQGD